MVVECVFKGDGEEELMRIAPTNRNIVLPIAFVVDSREGKIRKWESCFDVANVLKQIGAMPKVGSVGFRELADERGRV